MSIESQDNQYQGPLAGLNVIDFGHYYAGPMVGMLLADQGANVIRVVRPGESELPSQQYRLLNRNKKLLTLDLKTAEGKAQALSLIERADVVIENFRPGVMQRLGLDYANVKGENPGLVYLSLPGFASTDRERMHLQAWEGVVSAATGVYTEMHLFRQRLNFPPLYSWVPFLSMYAGINGGIAVMAALLARDGHGYGTIIEVPLSDVGKISGFRETEYSKETLPSEAKPLVYSPNDTPSTQMEKLNKAYQLLWAQDGVENFYTCADGRMIYIAIWGLQYMADSLLKALGLHKQFYEEGFVNLGPWVTNLDNNICIRMSSERQKRLQQLISDVLLTKTAEEWETILSQEGVMATVVRAKKEWLALKPILDSGVHVKLDNGKSTLTVPGRLGDVSGPKDSLIGGYREAQIITFQESEQLFFNNNNVEKKAPQGLCPHQNKGELLSGLKVLDLSNAAAGPVGGYWLTQYGADVVKADPSQHPLAPFWVAGRMYVDQGKRSILTDVKTAPGQDVFRQLVSWADVVIHNIVDDTAQRLGAAHEQLQKINHDVISCQISAFGGTRRGGWEKRVGFDFSAQAVSGTMVQYGTLAQPHIHGAGKLADVVGGFALAFTALLGVWQKRRTGYSGEGRTSLAIANNYVQLPFMIAENGNSDWNEPRGQFALGEHWWQRLYQCNDGWIYVGTSKERASVLFETISAKRFTDLQEVDEQALVSSFAAHSRTYWLEKLNSADVACHQVENGFSLYKQSTVRKVDNQKAHDTAGNKWEVLRWEEHPSGQVLNSPEPTWVRVGENQSYTRLGVAPRMGEDTTVILRKLGYSSDEIEELIRIKVSHEFLPALGNKSAYFYEPE